jgi:hypothetical protein
MNERRFEEKWPVLVDSNGRWSLSLEGECLGNFPKDLTDHHSLGVVLKLQNSRVYLSYPVVLKLATYSLRVESKRMVEGS